MKLKVNRQLSGGLYSVEFSVGDFTTDEVKKMESFGVPTISMMMGNPTSRQAVKIRLTGITSAHRISFPTEQEARNYEDLVVKQIREAMQSLRERKDDFSSTQEVDV